MDWTIIIVGLVWAIGGSLFVCKIACPLEDEKANKQANSTRQERANNLNTNTQYAFRKRQLYNERLNIYKDYHEGFSWTVLLFGFWPALFRGDWKWAVIIFLCNWVLWLPACIFFSIKYNELYTKDLLQSGYVIVGE